MNPPVHPVATSHHPSFITAPGETDVLMVVAMVVLLLAVVGIGVLYLKLYHLPAQYARTKLQYEIVGALALLALLTQMHIFWVLGILLALVKFPDFGSQALRIAEATERMAGITPGAAAEPQHHAHEGEPVAAARPERPAVPGTVTWAVRRKLIAERIGRLRADAARWWTATKPRLERLCADAGRWWADTKPRLLQKLGARK